MKDEFREKFLPKWETRIKEIFPFGVPSQCVWENKQDIIQVLNKIGLPDNLNHTFLPSGGGLDLASAKESIEKDCIELNFDGTCDIVKPIKLSFHSFNFDFEWNYFRLDTGDIQPSGVYENLSSFSYKKLDGNDDHRVESDDLFCYEELTELEPGVYLDRGIYEYGYYGSNENGDPVKLPKSARVVTRTFQGSYVIFCKASLYNANSATYDGRHNRMTDTTFKDHIQKAVNSIKKSHTNK